MMFKTKEEFDRAVETEVARRTQEIREQMAKIEKNTANIRREMKQWRSASR